MTISTPKNYDGHPYHSYIGSMHTPDVEQENEILRGREAGRGTNLCVGQEK